MKEREKSVEERIYPKGRKRIPQESSRIARWEPWSPRNYPWAAGVDLGKK
jgi:hypothetical protein